MALVSKIHPEEVLLIELIQEGEVSFESGELSVFFKEAEADGMEGADVHLVEVDGDVAVL